ncbi:MAG: beta strand repeat-containing protein [Flavobacterium sp.]|uniref:beta strand repeat-containing protein n=1 Tax=Flavobacterium sp. TaxID=239 RepID=UPI003787B2F3
MNKRYKLMAVAAICIIASAKLNAQVKSQKVGDSPTLINPSAALDVESATKGVLIPRLRLMSATDATTIIGGNVISLLVYNTNTVGSLTPGFHYWNGTQWTRIVSSADISSLVTTLETTTNLVDNGNGTVTYTNEDGIAQTINIAAMVTANEVDGVIGNELLNTTPNMGLTRSGSGTSVAPYTVGLTPGTATGQVMTWNGTAWTATAIPAEVDGIIGNEVTNASTNGGLTRLGTGTTIDPYTLGLAPGTAVGQTMQWNGTAWVPAAELDGIIGNEIKDVNSGKGLTRTGTGTTADPYKVGMTDGSVAGQVMQWDGTNWVTVDGESVVPNATTTFTGKVQLAGDLNGTGTTATAPRVSGLQGKPVSPTAPTSGQTLVFNGTSWVPTTPATVAEIDGVIGNEVTDVITNRGLVRTGTGTDVDPYKVGLTAGTATGQVITWNGTAWVPAAVPAEIDGDITNEIQTLGIAGNTVSLSNGGGSITLPAEVDGIIGNEVNNATANGGLVRSGSGTAVSPYTLGLTPGTTVGEIMSWNGTAWVPAAAGAEVDGIIGNEVTDVVANKGLARTGTGTSADPYKVQMQNGTAVGQIMKWDGTNWVLSTDAGLTAEVDGSVTNELQTLSIAGNVITLSNTGGSVTLPAEVDGIIGNEVTDAVLNGGLTRMGTGTTADPYKLKINDGSATNDVLTWDGTKWVSQAASTDWKTTGNAGTTAAANFIGTTDAVDFVTRTNNVERMRVATNGNVGLGVTAPTSLLHTAGPIATPITSGTASISLNNTHSVVRLDATAGDINITLPAAGTAPGRTYAIVKTDDSPNKLIFTATIQGNGFTFTQANVPGEYKIQSDGTNWILIK